MEVQNKVVIKRRFACSASQLFEWLTQPRLFTQWFGPKQFTIGQVALDPQVGGKLSIELVKGGHSIFIKGEYLTVDPPVRLSYSYGYEGLASPPPDSIVTINIQPLGEDQSELSLVQAFETASPDMNTRSSAWEHMFSLLQALVQG